MEHSNPGRNARDLTIDEYATIVGCSAEDLD